MSATTVRSTDILNKSDETHQIKSSKIVTVKKRLNSVDAKAIQQKTAVRKSSRSRSKSKSPSRFLTKVPSKRAGTKVYTKKELNEAKEKKDVLNKSLEIIDQPDVVAAKRRTTRSRSNNSNKEVAELNLIDKYFDETKQQQLRKPPALDTLHPIDNDYNLLNSPANIKSSSLTQEQANRYELRARNSPFVSRLASNDLHMVRNSTPQHDNIILTGKLKLEESPGKNESSDNKVLVDSIGTVNQEQNPVCDTSVNNSKFAINEKSYCKIRSFLFDKMCYVNCETYNKSRNYIFKFILFIILAIFAYFSFYMYNNQVSFETLDVFKNTFISYLNTCKERIVYSYDYCKQFLIDNLKFINTNN